MKIDGEDPFGLYTYVAIRLAGTPPEDRYSDEEWKQFIAEQQFEIWPILHRCLEDGARARGVVIPDAVLN